MRYSIASGIVLASAFATASVVERQTDCEAQATACRFAPDANQSFCSAKLAECLGFNPFPNGTATASSYVPKESCQAAADQCRTKPDANQSTCSAQLAACLGYNPYSNSTGYATEVVTKYTTYCPEATTLTYNGQPYTATKGETLTITNCPCTITKPIVAPTKPAGPPQVTVPPAAPTKNGAPPNAPAPTGPATNPTGPVAKPPVGGQMPDGQVTFTGAASLNNPATGLFAVGLCALAFF